MSCAPTSCPWRCGGWDGCITALTGGPGLPWEWGGQGLLRPVLVAACSQPDPGPACRLVGRYGVQEDRMDLHTVQVESHVMDPDLEVSMMLPLEEQGLMTIPIDPMAPNVTVEEQPPLTPPT